MEMTQLLKLWKNGDKAARDKLVEKNMGLVISIARRFIGRGHEIEDLTQVGCIGLIKAIDNFDCNYDVKFSTYAVPVITGEIKRFIRDDGLIKVSRSIKENGIKVRRAIEEIQKNKCEDASIEDIMTLTELTKEEVCIAIDASKEVESINQVVYSNGESNITVGDRIPDDRNEHEKTLDKLLLQSLMDRLDEFQTKLIHLRYYENKTQTEVAKMLGLTQVQVSRLEKKTLISLRGLL